uniref:C2H2-type domain-containing protein n=1 Tax=Panagrolaimus sp. PS1159 TaxID=55785 RepID=A0AC35F5N8_9BILA
MPEKELHQNNGPSTKICNQCQNEMAQNKLVFNADIPKIDNENYYSVEATAKEPAKKYYSMDSKISNNDEDVYFDALENHKMPVEFLRNDQYSYKPNRYNFNQNDNRYFEKYRENSHYSKKPSHQKDTRYSDGNRYFNQSNVFNERNRKIPKFLMSGNRVICQKNYHDIFEMIDSESQFLADNERYCEIFSGFLKVYHPERPFLCPYCDKLNKDRWDLFHHIENIHGHHYIPNGYWCQKCQCPLLNNQFALHYHMGFCRKSYWYEKVRGYPCYF